MAISVQDVKQLCAICNRLALHTCKLCGRPVCEDHFVKESGICTSCKRGRSG